MSLTHTTHICIVSGHPVPSLLPVLDRTVAPKHVVLVASHGSMEISAELLKRVFQNHSIEATIEKPISDHNVATMCANFASIAARYLHAILNTTGDKKFMTFAAYEAFLKAGHFAFYVERNNDLQWIKG